MIACYLLSLAANFPVTMLMRVFMIVRMQERFPSFVLDLHYRSIIYRSYISVDGTSLQGCLEFAAHESIAIAADICHLEMYPIGNEKKD